MQMQIGKRHDNRRVRDASINAFSFKIYNCAYYRF